MVAGSNPASGAIFQNTPKTPTYKEIKPNSAIGLSNYDTLIKNIDTKPLRLYKINSIFYYRRRINYKLVRISLHTKSLKIALKRKRLLDLIRGDEMFEIKSGDFKLMFEYDTAEELKVVTDLVEKMKVDGKIDRFNQVQEEARREPSNAMSFKELRNKYILKREANGKVSEDSLKAYITVFNFLDSFFGNKWSGNLNSYT